MKINIFTIFGIIIVLFFAGCINQNPPTTLQTNSNYNYNQNCRTVTFSEPYTEQECRNIESQEVYYDQNCQQVPYTDRVCESKKLVYNTQDSVVAMSPYCARERVDCLEQGLFGCSKTQKVCISYGYFCRLKINNLDDQSGTWHLKGGIFQRLQPIQISELNSTYPADRLDVVLGVQPHSYNYFEFRLESDTPDVRGLNSMHCDIRIIEEPTKQVCRDVIKTRELCNQVTKYRPATKQECQMVTKYRNKEKQECN